MGSVSSVKVFGLTGSGLRVWEGLPLCDFMLRMFPAFYSICHGKTLLGTATDISSTDSTLRVPVPK